MIRDMLLNEAEILSGIAFRSKAHWGSTAEFIERCRTELSVSAEYFEHNPTFVFVRDAAPIGFCSLERLSSTRVEPGHLFVDPSQMSQGDGRMLIDHACQQAQSRSYQTLVIQSDPNAERFYLAFGARRAGSWQSSSIPDRLLPLLELELNDP